MIDLQLNFIIGSVLVNEISKKCAFESQPSTEPLGAEFVRTIHIILVTKDKQLHNISRSH